MSDPTAVSTPDELLLKIMLDPESIPDPHPLYKELRETARAFLTQAPVGDPDQTLADALRGFLDRERGLTLDPDTLDMQTLSDHLRARVRVLDADGDELDCTRQLRSLGTATAPDVATQRRRSDVREWDFGPLPVSEQVEVDGIKVLRHPALVADADGYGPVGEDIPVAPIEKNGETVGYAYITTDFVGTIGYSGKPIKILIGLNLEGRITGTKLVEHSEPIVLAGIPEHKILSFIDGYKDLNIVEVAAADATATPPVDIVSGATNDAKYMTGHCPSGMIFVPCERGISHNETESETLSDLAA